MKDSKIILTPLFNRGEIAIRVQELGLEISSDFKDQEIIVVGVLKGAFIFLADLVRAISCPLRVDFIGVSSYVGTSSSGEVRITHDLSEEIAGRHVLIVEDIIDTGRTLDFLFDLLTVRKPASLRIASLLAKPEAHEMSHEIDYVGFEISKEFVVGYGLDLNGEYRNLADVMQIKLD